MNTNVNRPTRIAPEQVDTAIDEALDRVEEGSELGKDDLDNINGGIASTPPTGFIESN